MNKDEIIAMLSEMILRLQEQLDEANRKVAEANQKADALLAEISQNKSEKQNSPKDNGNTAKSKERPKTNNGAKRKAHVEVEVEEVDVEPDDPRFDADKARLYKTRDVIRYELIPMRFIKKIYHVKVYTQNDEFFSGKAPEAPFLNSQYDGSFIAGMAQLRYLYAMPVERIVRLINHIYHLEHQHKIGTGGWTERDNYKWRQEHVKPVMNIIRKKLDRMAADEQLLPKTEKYDAVHYMLNEWDGLMNIFKRGDYHLDNNLVERLNRYISLSRRNSLFFGSHAGAKRAAMLYSLACSCRLQGINFFEYISDIINKAAALPPKTPDEKYRELLPDRWKQTHIAQ